MTESSSAERRQIERRERDEPVPVERRRALRRMRDKLACPVCGHLASFVLPYRPTAMQQASGRFYRERRCANEACAARFHTFEQVDSAASK